MIPPELKLQIRQRRGAPQQILNSRRFDASFYTEIRLD